MSQDYVVSHRRPPGVYAFLLILVPLALIGEGGWLAILGCSYYYFVAGAVLIVSAILMWIGSSFAWLLLAVIAGTIPWEIWETGDQFWALLPRMAPPAVAGLWLLTSLARRGLDRASLDGHRPVVAPTLAVSLAVPAVSAADDRRP
ncbi:UNVERIFIED_ORG: glucose dehydrogenase [Rhizobium aethiopicum]|uniref:hypothetical protein n=1 Tax=Rhizobium sp. N122 TaxID=1764272 RepID=UPI000B736CC0|nr:hypothetical protein [Rhizobium sp. N122]OWV74977.1 hypothetical protein ATY75_30215 [Rhizobium sp. N122]